MCIEKSENLKHFIGEGYIPQTIVCAHSHNPPSSLLDFAIVDYSSSAANVAVGLRASAALVA